LSRKATAANLEFSVGGYFKDDKFIVAANFLTILAGLVCLKYVLRWQPTWENFIVPGFFLLGYFGSDVPTRLASVANRRLNAAIDYKTTIADQVAGLDPKTPTPATLPKDNK
jgi:hypothetical protein